MTKAFYVLVLILLAVLGLCHHIRETSFKLKIVLMVRFDQIMWQFSGEIIKNATQIKKVEYTAAEMISQYLSFIKAFSIPPR